MNAVEVKKLLLDKGLNVSEMSRTLIDENLVSSKNFDSVRRMLTALLYGREFYPSLARTVKSRFKITITRKAHLKSVREAVKQAV